MEENRLYTAPANQVLLRGVLLEAPVYSHENHGKQFDRMVLSVQRLSGTYDHLNILTEHGLTENLELLDGPMVQVRCCEGPPENRVRLTGTVCREPVYRHTPLGREITDLMRAVSRRYRRRDYVPCILWGSVARMGAECPVGTVLTVEGRLQSRCYVKQTEEGPEERTAYEVSTVTAALS